MGLVRRFGPGVATLAVLAAVGCTAPRGEEPEPQRAPAAEPAAQGITAAPFGEAGGTPVQLYTLTNRHGLLARITSYSATLTELHVPDRNGRLADVVLGFDRIPQHAGIAPRVSAAG